MRTHTAVVVACEALVGGLARLRLRLPALAAGVPGQWFALAQPNALSILPRPYPLTRLSPREGTIETLYHDNDPLAPWLAALQPGHEVALLGPWGRALPIDGRTRHAVLLASGLRLTGLLALAQALDAAGVLVVVLHDAPRVGDLLPPTLLPPAAEYHVATADGSAGVRGSVLDLAPPLLSWADALYAALPSTDHAALRDLVRHTRLRPQRGFATVLVETPLACYSGACAGCAVPLRAGGYGLSCKDGPAFDLLDLL